MGFYDFLIPIGSMYAIYMVTFTIFYYQYTPNVSIYTIHGSYGIGIQWDFIMFLLVTFDGMLMGL